MTEIARKQFFDMLTSQWFNHRDLADPKFKNDIFLNNNIFEPIDLSYLIPGKRRVKTNDATWYADEKDVGSKVGNKWHGYMTSILDLFNAYDWTVALNSKVARVIPRGGYVMACGDDKKCVIVRANDVKGGPGVDLTKVAADALGFAGRTSLELVDAIPYDCEDDIKTDNKHPLASCYKKEIILVLGRSQIFKGFRGAASYKRDNFVDFTREYLLAAGRIKDLGLNSPKFDQQDRAISNGIVRPLVYGEQIFEKKYDPKDHMTRYVFGVAYFSNMETALNYYDAYCSYCDVFECSDDERDDLDAQCTDAKIMIRDWRASGIHKYVKKNEVNVIDTICDEMFFTKAYIDTSIDLFDRKNERSKTIREQLEKYGTLVEGQRHGSAKYAFDLIELKASPEDVLDAIDQLNPLKLGLSVFYENDLAEKYCNN